MHVLYRQDATNASLNISSLWSFYTCAHMSNRSSFQTLTQRINQQHCPE